MKISKEQLMSMFLKDVCGKPYIMIGREPEYITLNYSVKDQKVNLGFIPRENIQKIDNPVIEITDFNLFQEKISDYVTKFMEAKTAWTTSMFADTELDEIKTALLSLWVNATWQDYENPIALIERYTSFLQKDKIYTSLKEGKQIYKEENFNISMKTKTNQDEMETPYSFYLEATAKGAKKKFPNVHYGVHNGEAYIYAVQGEKANMVQEDSNLLVQNLRQSIKTEGKKDDYRGAEPLAVMSLIAFLEVLKKQGIQKVNIPDFLPLRYITKLENFGEEKIDKVQNVVTNRLLLQVRRIMKYHSEGIKILSIPGETGNFLSIDIKDYEPVGELVRQICGGIDEKIDDVQKQER